MEPEELEQIVNAISKGFEKLNSATPSSKKEFSEFDVNLRSTSKKLQDLATVINNADIKTAKGSEERSEAEKLFVRTLKGKLDDIARSSGTVKDKLEKLEDTLKEVDGVTEEYKDKVRDSLREQIKYTEATRIQTEKTRIQTDTTEKYNIALNNFGKSLAPMANLVGGIIRSYQSGSNQIGMAGSLLSTEVGFAGDAAKMAGAGLTSVGAAASLSSSKLTRFSGGLATVSGLGLDLFGKGLSAVATKALPILTSEAEKVLNAFQRISSTGAVFGNGILGMQSAAKDAGLTLDQLSNVLKENKSDITDAGVGIVEGTKKIGETFKADAKSGGLLRETLDRLGYSVEEQASLISTTMGIIGRSGKSIKDVIPADLARTTMEYANSLRVIAAVSGKDAKSIQEKTRQQMNSIQLQTEIARRRAGGDKDVEARFNQILTTASAGGDTLVDATRQLLGPDSALMGNTAKIFAQLGPIGQDYINSTLRLKNDTTLTSEERDKALAKSLERFQDQMNKNPEILGKFARAAEAAVSGFNTSPDANLVMNGLSNLREGLSSFKPGSFDDAKKNIDQQKEAAKKQAEQNKKDMDEAARTGKKYVKTLVDPNDVTAGLLGVRDAAQELATSIQEKFLTTNVLPEFAKALTTATQNVQKLIDDYGNGVGKTASAVAGILGTITQYLGPIAEAVVIIGGAASGYKELKDLFKGTKPPGPRAPDPGDFKPGTGQSGPGGGKPPGGGGFKVDLNDLKNNKGGATSGGFKVDLRSPSSTTPELKIPKSTVKTGGIKGSLLSMAEKAGPMVESIMGGKLMAGVSGITSAINGDLKGVLDSAKTLLSGNKNLGASVTGAADAAGAKAAASTTESIGAKIIGKGAIEAAAATGAKMASKAIPGLGAITAALIEYEQSGSIGRSAFAGVGTLGGQIVGGALGAGVGEIPGAIAGDIAGKGLYDLLFGSSNPVEEKKNEVTTPATSTNTAFTNATFTNATFTNATFTNVIFPENKNSAGATLPRIFDQAPIFEPQIQNPNMSKEEVRIIDVANKMNDISNIHSSMNLQNVAPNNPKLTNISDQLMSTYQSQFQTQNDADTLLRKTDNITPVTNIQSSEKETTTQILLTLTREIGKMANALEEMLDYSRATANNTKNTYQAVS